MTAVCSTHGGLLLELIAVERSRGAIDSVEVAELQYYEDAIGMEGQHRKIWQSLPPIAVELLCRKNRPPCVEAVPEYTYTVLNEYINFQLSFLLLF